MLSMQALWRCCFRTSITWHLLVMQCLKNKKIVPLKSDIWQAEMSIKSKNVAT